MKRQLLRLAIALLSLVIPFSGISQMKAGDVDIFAGLEVSYRDILYNDRPMDFLIHLTPGVKWNLGKRWEIAAAAGIPIINQYGENSKYVIIQAASISKQIGIGKHWRTRFSGGVFTRNRYGFDIKTQYELKPWLALDAEIGLTGNLIMQKHWEASPMTRFTFLVGPDFWLDRWATQLMAKGGRFVYGDYGAVAEAYRHFKHTSVGLFAQYSNVGKSSAGFKIIIMIPPYKRSCRRVHFRPANNFRLTFSSESNSMNNVMYRTEPEQNERQGWFDRDLLPWGPDTMPPDFKPCEKKSDKENEMTESHDSEEIVTVTTEEVIEETVTPDDGKEEKP